MKGGRTDAQEDSFPASHKRRDEKTQNGSTGTGCANMGVDANGQGRNVVCIAEGRGRSSRHAIDTALETAHGTPADEASEQKPQLNFKMTKTYTITLILKHVKLVNEESFEKIWTYIGDDK